MGFFGLTDDSIQPGIAQIDPKTQSLIKDEFSHATSSNGDISKQLNSGIAASADRAGLSADQSARAAQTGENPGMFDAIRNQYRNIAQKDIRTITQKNDNTIPLQRDNWIKQATAHMMAQSQVQTEANSKLQQANMMADQARAQALNSILGAGGMAGGTAMANRGGRSSAPSRAPNGSMAGGPMDSGGMDAGGQNSFSIA